MHNHSRNAGGVGLDTRKTKGGRQAVHRCGYSRGACSGIGFRHSQGRRQTDIRRMQFVHSKNLRPAFARPLHKQQPRNHTRTLGFALLDERCYPFMPLRHTFTIEYSQPRISGTDKQGRIPCNVGLEPRIQRTPCRNTRTVRHHDPCQASSGHGLFLTESI